MEAQRAELHAVVFALGDEYAARYDLFLCPLPVHLYLRTDDSLETLHVAGRNDDIQFVALVNLGLGGRNDYSAVVEEPGNHEVCLNDVVDLEERLAVDERIRHLDGYDIGLVEGGIVGVLH